MTDIFRHKIGIIGLGQIGGSVAAALKTRDPAHHIIGHDISEPLAAEAISRGIVDQSPESQGELIEISDMVVIALPMAAIVETISDHGKILRNKILVTDTGSLKRSVMRTATKAGLDNFVGGHPLAGTEKRGSDAWDGQLFNGANYFFATSEQSKPAAIIAMKNLIEALGAIPVAIDPSRHDRIFATTSNLPHLFAFLLRRAHDELDEAAKDKQQFSCPSFRGSTRIAESDPEMVFQMLWHNRNNLTAPLQRMIEALSEAREALESGKPEGFRKIFDL